MISDVFLVEKLTKSRCGTSNTRPEAVSILNGLLFAINSSTSNASIRSNVLVSSICVCCVRVKATSAKPSLVASELSKLFPKYEEFYQRRRLRGMVEAGLQRKEPA